MTTPEKVRESFEAYYKYSPNIAFFDEPEGKYKPTTYHHWAAADHLNTAFAAYKDAMSSKYSICTWKHDEDSDWSVYEGSCGISWQFTEGGRKDNECNFCPRCGGLIVDATLPSPGESNNG